MKKTTTSFKILRVLLCVVFSIFALIPVYTALIVALTPYAHMLEAQLWPHYFEWINFVDAFNTIYRNIINSFIYAGTATVVTTIVAIPAAYVLSRYRFKGRKMVSFVLMMTQMLAGIVVLPNLYKMLNTLGLLNNRVVLVFVYSAFNMALVITILQGYFATLPASLDEAVAIDGGNYYQILTKLILPISGAGIAVGAIFIFVNTFNEFVIPLFLLSDANYYPLTQRIYSILTDTTPRWHIVAAASLLGIVPPVAIFTFFQQYIIQGVASGAVKG